jgi:hypothetical protein|tara:strand:- start:722 stop:1006 length:285 start_codon:yes stop_codon:yes gene_type:complete
MTIDEIKISVTMALVKSAVTRDDDEGIITVNNDIQKQTEIVGDFLGKKFLLSCIKKAEDCLVDDKKFDELWQKFEPIGARFTDKIDDPLLEEED